MEFKKLTEKQLEEAKKCTTEEEKKAFLKKQKINLPDDVLESTVGGDSTEDGLKCTRCGRRFDSYTDVINHVFWDHFIGA